MSAIFGVNVGGSLYTVSDSGNVAPVEYGSSAARNYAVGDFLIMKDGMLYKAITAISAGDTLVINSNVSNVKIGEELVGRVTRVSLNTLLNVTIPTTGWVGESAPYTNTVSIAGVTAQSVPFVSISYPDDVTASQKKAINKAAGLFTKMETGNGTVTITALDIPQTAVTLSLRGV